MRRSAKALTANGGAVAKHKALKEQIDDVEALRERLSKETSSGSGPVFDVVVWHDGERYKAVLNTLPMAPYVRCETLRGEVSAAAKRDEVNNF